MMEMEQVALFIELAVYAIVIIFIASEILIDQWERKFKRHD